MTRKMTIWLLKPSALIVAEAEEVGKRVRLDLEGDVLAAGQAEDDAAADEQHGQRRDEGGHFEDGDEEAVDQADRQAEHEAPEHRGA